MTTGLWAVEASRSVRSSIAERLRSEFPYQEKSEGNGGSEVEEVIAMEPFVVTGKKDHSREITRIFEEKRRLELEQKPSIEGGASIGDRTILGPRPYRDLFKEDARFKTAKAITPFWTLLELR